MGAILQFNNLQVSHLQWVNSTNILLLLKSEESEEITEYSPISLIHAIAKIIAKMISIRLAPLMNELASNAQTAFIKKENYPRQFHVCGQPREMASQEKNANAPLQA
jgi:hypothetical protein